MATNKKNRIMLAIILTLVILFTETGGQKAFAKKANPLNYMLSGSSKSIRSYESSFIYRYTKIKFHGNQVTFQGNILLIPEGNGKTKIVKKLTLKLAANCKFFVSDGDGSTTPALKKNKIKQYQKLDFGALMVTVKKGKVVKFDDGWYD